MSSAGNPMGLPDRQLHKTKQLEFDRMLQCMERIATMPDGRKPCEDQQGVFNVASSSASGTMNVGTSGVSMSSDACGSIGSLVFV